MTENNRNLRAAKRFRTYKILTLIVFFAVLVIGLFSLKDELTAENFKYLIKYIDFSTQKVDKSEYSIRLSARGDTPSSPFKEDFAIISADSFNLYSFNDELLYTQPIYMSYPSLKASKKYVICYDTGGNSIKVFNSFSPVWEMSYEYPIVSADVNDNGYVCVVTSESGYQAVVYVYNANGKNIFTWRTADKFVTDASISNEREPYIVVSAVKAENGDYSGEIITVKINEESTNDIKKLEGVFPVSIYCCSDGSYDILAENSFSVYRKSDGTVNSYRISSGTMRMFRHGDEYSAVVTNDNKLGNNARIVYLDKTCSMKYSFSITNRLMDISIRGNTSYVLTMGILYCVDIEKGSVKEIPVSSDFKAVNITEDNRVVLLSEEQAIAFYVD